VENRGFRFLEHTADAEFLAWAPTMEGAFEQAAQALISIVCDTDTVRRLKEFTIDVKAENEEELLFAFLAEILFIQDSQGILSGAVELGPIEKISGNLRLRGSVLGEPYDSSRHVLLGSVKAPTYHNLAVRRRRGVVETRVLVDL